MEMTLASVRDLETAKAFVRERKTLTPAEHHMMQLMLDGPEVDELNAYIQDRNVAIVGSDEDAI